MAGLSSFVSVCDGVSLLVCFAGRQCCCYLPLFLFYWARLVLRFHPVCGSDCNRAFLLGFIAARQLGLPSQLFPSLSSYLGYFRTWCSLTSYALLSYVTPLCSFWSSYHFGNPRADFTTGLGPVGVFPRHAQGIPLSIRASFPFVLDYALLYVFMRSGRNPLPDRRCRSRHHSLLRLQGLLPFGTSYTFWARQTCFPAVNRVSSRSMLHSTFLSSGTGFANDGSYGLRDVVKHCLPFQGLE